MATGNIPGTTIPYSALAGLKAANIDRYNHVVSRIQSEIANGNTTSINDALFDVAYYSQRNPDGSWGRGQGNSNVSKVHDGSWTVTAGAEPTGHKTWAETYINSPNDVYVQDNNDVVTMDPNTGKVLVNMKDSDGNWGAGPVGAVISGDQSGLDANMTTWLSGNALPGGETVLGTGGGGGGGGTQAQMNLLEYRPWTQAYASKYLTGGAGDPGLLTMDKTSIQPEYSLAYLPGEFRDPGGWQNWAGGETGHSGHIPEGGWRRATMNPASAANLAAGRSAYAASGDPRQNIWAKSTQANLTGRPAGVTDYRYLNAPGWNISGYGQAGSPWDFTAPAHSQGNINWQDWSPSDMNLTGPDAEAWQGLLKTMDTSPITTPGLLSTEKGGPINFGT